ncbi:hypothetical protein GCM10009754_19490 [Amycolatopsis minnesotensis]|uniref:Uncharacterized protein n=1 Tax=Amycolatopsis minnesotensis TaxID=337894 RepID=A0ABN2QEL9_9PSEU
MSSTAQSTSIEVILPRPLPVRAGLPPALSAVLSEIVPTKQMMPVRSDGTAGRTARRAGLVRKSAVSRPEIHLSRRDRTKSVGATG